MIIGDFYYPTGDMKLTPEAEVRGGSYYWLQRRYGVGPGWIIGLACMTLPLKFTLCGGAHEIPADRFDIGERIPRPEEVLRLKVEGRADI